MRGPVEDPPYSYGGWGEGESLMIPGEDITGGATVRGYLSLVILEDDIGVFREGGEVREALA